MTNPESTRLQETLRAFRRWWLVIVVCTITVPLAVLGFSLLQETQYSSIASLLFRDPGLDQKLFGSTFFQPNRDPAREAQTNLKLVELSTVADRTARVRGRGLTRESVKSKVEISPAGDSDVINVRATDPSPKFSALLANTFARQYIAFRRQADRAKITQAQRLVDRQIRDARSAGRKPDASILQRDEQLKILAALQTGNVELVQLAEVPTVPSSPRTVRNTALGLLIGFVIGLLAALVLDRLDRRIRSTKEVEEIFERPILGAIPESRGFDRGKSSSADRELTAIERESFLMLRANLLYFNVDHDLKSLVVTSATPSEGKSTVAWNLATVNAQAGARTLLLEADMRKPQFQQRHGLAPTAGLSGVLAGAQDFDRAVQRVPLAGRGGEAGGGLDVLIAGPTPPNPADLIESERMRELLRDLEERYDLVVIDTPPVLVVSDAISVLRFVSGVIAVCRLRKTTRDSAAFLRDKLRNLNAPVLGVVVNAASSEPGGYGYGYGYEDTTQDTTPREPAVLAPEDPVAPVPQ